MRDRWRAPILVFLCGAVFLAWAWPRLSPAARLGLKFDHDGYLAQARQLARSQGFNLDGWRGYADAETLAKNQDLHDRMPGDSMARLFPDAQVVTSFHPGKGGAAAKLTLRPDGRPLSWKLSGVPATAASLRNDTAMAHKAMESMTGDDASNYAITTEGESGANGMSFRWKRIAPNRDMPQTGIEVSVRDGAVWQVNTNFTFPEKVKSFDSFSVFQLSLNTAWYLLAALGLLYPVLRSGATSAARALKDRCAVVIGIAVAVAALLDRIAQWDDMAISSSGTGNLVLLTITIPAFMGLFFYVVSAIAILNARLNPLPLRGFRLLGTGAFFSRFTAAEMLGGWLVAPAIVAAPLVVSALTRLPAFKGYDDDAILSPLAWLDAWVHTADNETLTIVTAFGVLVPLAMRFFRPGVKRMAFLGIATLMTFALLDSPFHAKWANLMCAGLDGAAMFWVWSRFGLLGAVSARCLAQVLTTSGVLLVQPAHALQSSGWGILTAFGAAGLVLLATAVKGPEVVEELYGGSDAGVEARSRREELLAEFNVARSAQQRMLPAEPPAIEGFTIAASCEPAREVGGDLYDFLRVRDGRWGIAVADVSGKGVPAALYMTLTKGLLCAASQESGDPRWILAAVNRHLKSVTKRKMFVTMAFAVLDPESKRMDYVRAGHNPVVWRRFGSGETRLLSGAGIGLGIAAPALFGKTLAIETLHLGPGDALVFYSDGLTEAMNERLEQFGEERLMAAVERADGMQASAARDSILGEVRRFLAGVHAQDDLTIAVLRVNAEPNGDTPHRSGDRR